MDTIRVLKAALFVIFVALLADVGFIVKSHMRPAKEERVSLTTPGTPVSPNLHLGAIVRLVMKGGRTFCTGTVINDTTIITAAHCVVFETPFGMIPNQAPIEIRARDNIAQGVTAKAKFVSPQMDQAILVGDFKRFEHKAFTTDADMLTAYKNSIPPLTLIACGYPLFGDLYCNPVRFIGPMGFAWAVRGTLLPGMSGGPTMLPDGTVVAINVAVERDFSIVSPIYNLYPQPGDR